VRPIDHHAASLPQNDPNELTNLYRRAVVATIQEQLRAWMRETGVTK
jgi:hypothetical protein